MHCVGCHGGGTPPDLRADQGFYVAYEGPLPAPAAVLDALEASVNQFMGPLPAADDLTMLVLKRNV